MNQVIILLLGTGTLVSSTKTEPCPDTAQLSCGNNTYNPLTEKCCQGAIRSLTNMTHPDCCRNRVYDMSTHLCCSHNGKADSTDVSKMDRPECCGIKAYDETVSKCCSADVEESMPIVYLPGIQSCKHSAKVDVLPKQVFPDMRKAKCGDSCGVFYDPKHQKCCLGKVVVDVPANTTHPDCCGEVIYDRNTHKCCAGKLHDIGGTVQPSCCGTSGSFYDQASELCCDGAIKYFHGLGLPACCGKEAIDLETHECANGKVSVKKIVQKVQENVKSVPKDVKGLPKDVKGVQKDVKSVPKDVKGPPKDVKGPPKDVKGAPMNVKGVQKETPETPQKPMFKNCPSTQFNNMNFGAQCNSVSMMHSIYYPDVVNLKKMDIQCCKSTEKTEKLTASQCEFQEQPVGNRALFKCPKGKFIRSFCMSTTRHCINEQNQNPAFMIACCTYKWSSGSVVETDVCRERKGWGGRNKIGMKCAANEFMTEVCAAKGNVQKCKDGEDLSAMCCSLKSPRGVSLAQSRTK